MLRVLAEALAARFILLLAVIGAFILAWKAMSDVSYMALGVLAVYSLVAIPPVVYLEIRRRS